MDGHSEPRSTAQEIVGECRRIRILVVGKTGSGKSSLVNHVFNIKDAKVSHLEPGQANINDEYHSSDNAYFVLHDSQGFQPNEDVNFNTVVNFIDERSTRPKLEDKLHAIWVCIEVPVNNDRILEAGVERILGMAKGPVPVIVVFTKYDQLVSIKAMDVMEKDVNLSEEQIFARAVEEALPAFNALCLDPLKKCNSAVLWVRASTQRRFYHTISNLVKVTYEEIRKRMPNSIKIIPVIWAIAQRRNTHVNIDASVAVGQRKYWSGLASGTDFSGKKLRVCLDIIHLDIVTVWNFWDLNSCLNSSAFKGLVSHLVEGDLGELQNTTANTQSPEGISAFFTTMSTVVAPFPTVAFLFGTLGATVRFASWLSDVYQNTDVNVRCIMGYIVNLTIILHGLWWHMMLNASNPTVSMEDIAIAFDTYAKSQRKGTVHVEIRNFVADRKHWNLTGKDDVRDKIISLIQSNCIDPVDSYKV